MKKKKKPIRDLKEGEIVAQTGNIALFVTRKRRIKIKTDESSKKKK